MIDIETSNAIQKQMLDKMEHYRAILRDVAKVMRGDGDAIGFFQCRMMVEKELSLNPKWEVLENLPHGGFIHSPDAYKSINTGPDPK